MKTMTGIQTPFSPHPRWLTFQSFIIALAMIALLPWQASAATNQQERDQHSEDTRFSPSLQAETPSFIARYAFGPSEDETSAVNGADLNGDGHLDLVVANYQDAPGYVYMNDGSGTFHNGPVACDDPTDQVSCFGSASSNVWSIAIADIDGQNGPDIVAASYTQQSAVYLNDGAGNFASGDIVCGSTPAVRCFGPVDGKTYGIVSGDVDSDGDNDIVTANNGRENVVYLNDGEGNFQSGKTSCNDDAETRCFGTGLDPSWSVALDDVDGENGLDIIVGNYERQNMVYLNKGSGDFHNGALTCGATPDVLCLGEQASTTSHVQTGDLNNDGMPDIVVSNRGLFDNTTNNYLGASNTIYLNDGTGDFPATSAFMQSFGTGQDVTLIASLGDIDSDGDLDIVTGSGPQEQNAIYLNHGQGRFSFGAAFGASTGNAYGVALADFDGDSDLDVVIGNGGSQNAVYANNGIGRFALHQPFAGHDSTVSIATGDLNDDGYSDLIVGNRNQQNMVYLNDGTLSSQPYGTQDRPFGTERSMTTSVAVGDIEGDGDLDIVVGNMNDQNAIYVNDGSGTFHTGTFVCRVTAGVHCFGTSNDTTMSIALADIEGDGDLDIVTANAFGEQNVVYLNDGDGNFYTGRVRCDNHASVRCFGTGGDSSLSVTTADVDTDGDHDLIVGNDHQQNRVYLNDGLGYFQTQHPFGAGLDTTTSVSAGDMDGDGDLDIVTGNHQAQNIVYLNSGYGTFYDRSVRCGVSPGAHCFGTGLDTTQDLTLSDIDGDGDLDIGVGNNHDQSAVYLNDGAGHFDVRRTFGPETDAIVSVAVADIDRDGDLDIVAGKEQQSNAVYFNGLATPYVYTPPSVRFERIASLSANRLPSPVIITDLTIPIEFQLLASSGESVQFLRAFYSLDGGGRWLPANQSNGSNVVENPETNTLRTYEWDTFQSGFFGQSDTVVFRIEAYPSLDAFRAGVSEPSQRPYMAAQTQPFRARATLVRVLRSNQPVQGSLVFRQQQGGSQAQPIVAGGRDDGISAQPFLTNGQGYLQGRAELHVADEQQAGDSLVAMVPVSATHSYTLYHTSAPINAEGTGMQFTPVQEPGVQELTISEQNPLVLFNLDVSLEWDARADQQFLARLEDDLQRTSEILYDWTDGQAGLGDIRIYHNREKWNDAHIRIYATNRLRPNANQGGIITGTEVIDPDKPNLTYETGQVRMGAVWNRYGESSGTMGEDWPRTLAHELGHYAFFLDDNYIGFDNDGLFITIYGCPGAMSDPYLDNYSEFHPSQNWLPDCKNTLSHKSTERSDWETITTFYPGLLSPDAFNAKSGPYRLQMDVTETTFAEPDGPTEVLEVPSFDLIDGEERAVYPGNTARAFLFQREGMRLIDLGKPTLNRIDARGARPGDELCLYDLANHYLGCERIRANDQQMEVGKRTDWNPDIIITPVTSRTVRIAVEHVPSGLTLKAQLFPVSEDALDVLSLQETSQGYSGLFTVGEDSEPVLEAYVRIWVEEDGSEQPRREIVSDYLMGGNPGSRRSKRAPRGSPGSRRSKRAPILSGDGQAMIVGKEEDMDFEPGEFYALQSTLAYDPPEWATLVGQAYRLTVTANAPALRGNASISLSYLSDDVVPGEEPWIKVYYWENINRSACSVHNWSFPCWRPLATMLNTEHNMAVAQAQGPGVYALMSSIEIPLEHTGWNLISYPVKSEQEDSQSVGDLLSSIDGQYTIIYGFDPVQVRDPWNLFSRDVLGMFDSQVNTLQDLEFGQGYLIYATKPITLYLKGTPETNVSVTTLAESDYFPPPPSTSYGLLEPTANFVPQVGMPVVAMIGDAVCGQSQVVEIGEAMGFVIDVLADGADDDGAGKQEACGAPGRKVTFFVEDYQLPQTFLWDNTQVHSLSSFPIYIPIVSVAGYTS